MQLRGRALARHVKDPEFDHQNYRK
jgi:hypothetical protein